MIRHATALLPFVLCLGTPSTWAQAPAPADIPKKGLEEHFNAGSEALQAGDWQRALDEFHAVILQSQEIPGAYGNRGLAWEGLGEPEQAIADLTRCIEDCARAEDEAFAAMRRHNLTNRARVRLASGLAEQALEDLDAVLAEEPQRAAAMHQRAMTLFVLGRMTAAHAAGAAARELDPQLPELVFPEQLTEPNRRVVAAPRDAAAFAARAESWLALAKAAPALAESALADFRQATHLAPDNAGYWLRRGVAEEARPRSEWALADGNEAALACFDRAVALDDRLGEAWLRRGLQRIELAGLGFTLQDDAEQDVVLQDLVKSIELGCHTREASQRRAKAFQSATRPALAATEFSRLLAETPDDVELLAERAGCWQGVKDHDRAIADRQRVVELQPDNPEARAQLARTLEYAERFEPAIAAWESAKDATEPVDLQAHLGDCCIGCRQYDAAIAHFDTATALEPGRAELWLGRAKAKRLAGRTDDALADYRRAHELDDKVPAIAADLANASEVDDTRSQCALRRLSAEFSQHSAALTQAAVDVADAERAMEQAREELRRSLAALQSQKPADVIADVGKAIAAGAGTVADYQRRGDAYYELRDWEHAQADYEAALRLEPTSAVLTGKLGNAQLAAGEEFRPRAIETFSKAIALDGTIAAIWNRRGVAHELSGDLDQALADQSRAIELDPTLVQAWSDRGDVRMAQKEYRDAQADFSRAIELLGEDGGRWRILLNRGNANFMLDDFAAAIADYDAVLALRPEDEMARGNRAVAQRRLDGK